jgi:hypothetical protein
MSITQSNGAIICTGEGVNIFQAIAVKGAIKLYINTGMKANRAYTPTNMLATAGRITGKTFKRGQLQAAHDALVEWIAAAKEARGDNA